MSGGVEDNSKIIISFFLTKTYVMTPHQQDGSNGGSQNMFKWRNMANPP